MGNPGKGSRSVGNYSRSRGVSETFYDSVAAPLAKGECGVYRYDLAHANYEKTHSYIFPRNASRLFSGASPLRLDSFFHGDYVICWGDHRYG